MVCCLLVTLALYGVSSALVALLGSNHTHSRPVSPEASASVLEDFRRLDPLDIAAGAPQTHTHLSLQRHHHDPADTSVQSVDGAAGDDLLGSESGASTLGSLVLLAGAAGLLMVAMPLGVSVRWAVGLRPAVPSGYAHPLERPPRT